ncbi:hypothetical protein [Actinomadura sp. J1-007]|uniref:hypothetical protein n=1 Tax=Actinomadura sp. J1-007 TaxID=2661913 RepID=UPI0013713DB1|nr:hypothetical protein [Actinomadura sp. J1-007]
MQGVVDLGEALERLGVVLGELRQPLGGAFVDDAGAAFRSGEGALGLQPRARHRLLRLLLGGRQDALGLLLRRREDLVGLLLRLREVALGVRAGVVHDPLGLGLGVLADLLALGLGLGHLVLGLVLGQVDDLPQPVAQVVAGRLAGLAHLGHLAPDPLRVVVGAGEPGLQFAVLLLRAGDVILDLAAVEAAHDDLELVGLFLEEVGKDFCFVAHGALGVVGGGDHPVRVGCARL